jgi:hypothetical protein
VWEEVKHNIKRGSVWLRLVYMILFAVIYNLAEVVLAAVIVLQFIFVLVTTERNLRLLSFGASLSRFLYQIFLYLTFNSEQRPFPFDEWPPATESATQGTRGSGV